MAAGAAPGGGRQTAPRRPRVAVVLSGFGVVGRGAEAFLAELLPRLEARCELEVYSRSGAGPGGVGRPAIPRRALEPLYRSALPVRKLLDTLFLDPIHVEWTSHLLASLPRLARGGYDVIWHETGRWGGRLLAALRRRTGVRLLDVAHGSHPGWEIPFARLEPDVYVSFSRAQAETVRRAVPGLRLEVVPPGVDTDRFRPDVEPLDLGLPPPVVLAVGAAPEKRVDLALEAAARSGASLAVAGGGREAPALDALALGRLGPERYRRLTLPRAEMPRLYAAADAVILASDHESAPMTLLEAMACGRPVVTAADATRREMVGAAGILVERQEVGLYAAAVGRALAAAPTPAPRRRALEFTIERTAGRFADLLEELAEARR